MHLVSLFDQNPHKSITTELAGDGRPASGRQTCISRPSGDCCGLPSPTRSPGGSKRPETTIFKPHFVLMCPL